MEVFDPIGYEFCRVIDMDLLYSSTCGHPARTTPFVEDAFFFPLHIFGFIAKNQASIGVWIYIWVFNSIPLIHLSGFMLIPHGYYYYYSVVELKSGMMIPLEIL